MTLKTMDNNKINQENDKEQCVRHSDFSIDHILNRAGSNVVKNSDETVIFDRKIGENIEKFGWLQCSRYYPPKVPRLHKKDIQKRQLGRHPRIPFTSQQLSILEQKFRESPYLSSEQVIVLSKKLQLADMRVKIWFQNRRARERREKNGIFIDNRRMESESKSCMQETLSRCSPDIIPKNNFKPNVTDEDSRDVKKQSSSSGKQKIETDTKNFIDYPSTSISISSHVNNMSPYFLCNSSVNPNMPLLVPFVNFACSNNRDDIES